MTIISKCPFPVYVNFMGEMTPDQWGGIEGYPCWKANTNEQKKFRLDSLKSGRLWATSGEW